MRAWHCHGRNQRDLVDRLKQANIVKTSIVEQVLQQVDRRNYVDTNSIPASYMDAPQGIGLGMCTERVSLNYRSNVKSHTF